MKLSARNVFQGTIKQVHAGMVNSEIVVALPGGQEIVSIITKTSAENLGLHEGAKVYAVVKATSVMLAVD